MRRERGQSSVEFVLVAAFVALALCTPWLGGESPADMLLAAIGELAVANVEWLKVI